MQISSAHNGLKQPCVKGCVAEIRSKALGGSGWLSGEYSAGCHGNVERYS
ncbi:MAG: hypothetical protein IJZ80_11025 [Clostridia bacterium]|nr:hypothetical protein [Clostridia bacterium]